MTNAYAPDHSVPTSTAPGIDALQQNFLAMLPRIELHAEIMFRHLRCPHKQADAIQETIAVAWQWFLRATEQGKDVNEFVSALATFATRHVRAGRRLCGLDRARDVLSPVAQQKKGFTISSLPKYSTLSGSIFDQALRDNTQSPVPDQVAFRCDFPVWLERLSDRNRRLARDMALGHCTQDLAAMHTVTQGRISQLRRYFMDDWERFTATSEEAPSRPC
jgi:hypothetical protein